MEGANLYTIHIKLIFSRVLLNTATYVCRCSTMKLQVAIT